MFRITAFRYRLRLRATQHRHRRRSRPIEPFNGKDLTGWKLKDEKKSQWEVGASMRVDPNKPRQSTVA